MTRKAGQRQPLLASSSIEKLHKIKKIEGVVTGLTDYPEEQWETETVIEFPAACCRWFNQTLIGYATTCGGIVHCLSRYLPRPTRFSEVTNDNRRGTRTLDFFLNEYFFKNQLTTSDY
jgi:hypothetical protein